jgi:hypothetical protein
MMTITNRQTPVRRSPPSKQAPTLPNSLLMTPGSIENCLSPSMFFINSSVKKSGSSPSAPYDEIAPLFMSMDHCGEENVGSKRGRSPSTMAPPTTDGKRRSARKLENERKPMESPVRGPPLDVFSWMASPSTTTVSSDRAPALQMDAAPAAAIVPPTCPPLATTATTAAAATGGNPAVKPKMTMEERQKNKFKRQEEVMNAIGAGGVTEKTILDNVGDSRYTREILRRLLAQGVVRRVGKGGSNDPFLYTVVADMVGENGKALTSQTLADPGLEVRLRRIENKITVQLSKSPEFTTEKAIRLLVGDNTGTGKALRRLVASSRVLRIGKGGVSDPFRYKYNTAFVPPPDAPPASTSASSRRAAPSAPIAASAASSTSTNANNSAASSKIKSPAGTSRASFGLSSGMGDALTNAARARMASSASANVHKLGVQQAVISSGSPGSGVVGLGGELGSPPGGRNWSFNNSFNGSAANESYEEGNGSFAEEFGLPVVSPGDGTSRCHSALSDRATPPQCSAMSAIKPPVALSTAVPDSDDSFLAASFLA